MTEPWATVTEIARRQHGLVHLDQLVRLGLSHAAIRWAVERHRLERRRRGLFVLPGSPPSWRQRACEVVLLSGPGAVLSHATAAHLWGLDGFERAPTRFDVTVPRRRSASIPCAARVHRSRATPRAMYLGGLPITSIANTLVDLAAELDDEALEIALDSAHRRWPRVGQWIEDLATKRQTRGVPGLTRLVQLVREREGQPTDSPLEVRVWRRLRSTSGLPKPRLQVEVFDELGYIMRVDFAWPLERVVVHADSFRWHSRRVTFDSDADQRNRLRAAGWEALVVTQNSLHGPWLDDLKVLLAQRHPQRSFSFATNP